MNFYLMYCNKQERYIIDSKQNELIELKDQCIAKSWIHAKQQFGFPLTTKQESILQNS